MATWNTLRAQEAGQAAYNEAFPQELAAIEDSIAGKLESAEGGLVASIILVAEACGISPEKIETIQDGLRVGAGNVVRSIFTAAVEEVSKNEVAKSEAEAIARRAMEDKKREIFQVTLRGGTLRKTVLPPLAQPREIPYGSLVRRGRRRG